MDRAAVVLRAGDAAAAATLDRAARYADGRPGSVDASGLAAHAIGDDTGLDHARDGGEVCPMSTAKTLGVRVARRKASNGKTPTKYDALHGYPPVERTRLRAVLHDAVNFGFFKAKIDIKWAINCGKS